uniref:Uncharacterized protein n=1 Tax=Arundo donax TaxID=35708 RepID=A0A0A8ZG38_ARUDO
MVGRSRPAGLTQSAARYPT